MRVLYTKGVYIRRDLYTKGSDILIYIVSLFKIILIDNFNDGSKLNSHNHLKYPTGKNKVGRNLQNF